MTLKFLKLAFKNVTRNLRRTIITGLIMAFGVICLILAGGFMRYSFWGLGENAIRGQYGHLQIFNPEFLEQEEDKPLQFGIDRSDSLIGIIQSARSVQFAMPRIEFMGLLSNGEKSEAFIGEAIEPQPERRLSESRIRMDQGNHLGEDTSEVEEDEVILAAGLAKSLKANLGDYLTLMVTTTTGALNAVDVKLVGVFSTGVPELDARLLKVKLATAQRLLVTDRVTKIVVVLKETALTDAAAEQISALLPNYKVKRWHELDTFYQAVVKLYNTIFGFMGILIFVIVLLASSNTMMMSIFERTREIGTLMAIGSSGKRVLGNFLLEGLVIGAIASASGLLLGFLLSFLINHAGIMMPPPPGSTFGYPLNVHYVASIYVGSYIFMVVTAVISTLIPASKAARMKIVDALGHI